MSSSNDKTKNKKGINKMKNIKNNINKIIEIELNKIDIYKMVFKNGSNCPISKILNKNLDKTFLNNCIDYETLTNNNISDLIIEYCSDLNIQFNLNDFSCIADLDVFFELYENNVSEIYFNENNTTEGIIDAVIEIELKDFILNIALNISEKIKDYLNNEYKRSKDTEVKELINNFNDQYIQDIEHGYFEFFKKQSIKNKIGAF
jgi:hypothetical protein